MLMNHLEEECEAESKKGSSSWEGEDCGSISVSGELVQTQVIRESEASAVLGNTNEWLEVKGGVLIKSGSVLDKLSQSVWVVVGGSVKIEAVVNEFQRTSWKSAGWVVVLSDPDSLILTTDDVVLDWAVSQRDEIDLRARHVGSIEEDVGELLSDAAVVLTIDVVSEIVGEDFHVLKLDGVVNVPEEVDILILLSSQTVGTDVGDSIVDIGGGAGAVCLPSVNNEFPGTLLVLVTPRSIFDSTLDVDLVAID